MLYCTNLYNNDNIRAFIDCHKRTGICLIHCGQNLRGVSQGFPLHETYPICGLCIMVLRHTVKQDFKISASVFILPACNLLRKSLLVLSLSRTSVQRHQTTTSKECLSCFKLGSPQKKSLGSKK